MPTLDNLHTRITRNRWMQRFTAMTRVLLAFGFFEPGMVKVLDLPFTALSPDTPIGGFFDAFFQASAYYQFVGIAQVAAALLLLFPATATLGAVIYFPIILNIFVITVTLHFTGTWVITGLMLLAVTYLFCWDYPKLKHLLPARATRTEVAAREYAFQALFWASAGAAAYGLLFSLRIAGLQNEAVLPILGVATVAGAIFGLTVAWHLRHLPAPHPNEEPARQVA